MQEGEKSGMMEGKSVTNSLPRRMQLLLVVKEERTDSAANEFLVKRH